MDIIIFIIIGILIGGVTAFSICWSGKKDNSNYDSIIFKLNILMADSAQIKQQVIDLNAKADALQASVDAEQLVIQGLLDTNAQVVTDLTAEVARLQAIIDNGGVVTPEDLQTISDGITSASDKLATTQSDIEGTVA